MKKEWSKLLLVVVIKNRIENDKDIFLMTLTIFLKIKKIKEKNHTD